MSYLNIISCPPYITSPQGKGPACTCAIENRECCWHLANVGRCVVRASNWPRKVSLSVESPLQLFGKTLRTRLWETFIKRLLEIAHWHHLVLGFLLLEIFRLWVQSPYVAVGSAFLFLYDSVLVSYIFLYIMYIYVLMYFYILCTSPGSCVVGA